MSDTAEATPRASVCVCLCEWRETGRDRGERARPGRGASCRVQRAREQTTRMHECRVAVRMGGERIITVASQKRHRQGDM
eukprot:1803126-Prymnesium_polylepis.1